MNSAPHVLVIDGTSDTEAVLRAVLEPRGTHVERSRGTIARQGQRPDNSPHVVVIDIDDDSTGATADCFGDSYRILIGSTKAPMNKGDRFLTKPFQYPDLLKTIEDLLALPPAA